MVEIHGKWFEQYKFKKFGKLGCKGPYVEYVGVDTGSHHRKGRFYLSNLFQESKIVV